MDPIKALILKLGEGFPAPPEIPLEEAPAPEYDLGVAMLCPQCGSTYCNSEVVDGVYQARCNQCGCEFCQPKESMSRRLVRSVMEQERRRKHLLDIPTVRHKSHKRQSGAQQRHDTENTGVGLSRRTVNDRVMSDR